ncbi:response regulator [Thalassotalea ganghwensis]
MSSSVLICDDSNLARKQVLRSLPESLKLNVELATNGQEAVNLLQRQNVDLLFLDLTMPILDGVGVLQAIKDHDINVSVFVISADIQPEMQAKVLSLGAKAFLKKPIQQALLIEQLTDHGFV